MEISGVLNIAGQPQNGVYMDVWPASVFAVSPSFNTAAPTGGGFTASVVSGTAYGQPGGYYASVSVTQDYWVRAKYNNDNYWALFPAYSAAGNTQFTHITYPGPASVGSWTSGTPIYDSENATWLNVSSGTPGTWLPITGRKSPDWPQPQTDTAGNPLYFGYEFQGNITSGSVLPTGFSWLNEDSALYLERNGAGSLRKYAPNSGVAGPNVSGIQYTTLPSVPWYFVAKLHGIAWYKSGSYNKVGIFVTDGTKIYALETLVGSAAYPANKVIETVSYTNPTTFNAVQGYTGEYLEYPTYMAMMFFANEWDTFISPDGVGWSMVNANNFTGSAAPLTPTGVGFFVDPEGWFGGFGVTASRTVATCEWFRIYTGDVPADWRL